MCNVFGDPTPGPRHFPNFESSPFPWRETIDEFEDVASADSYRTSMKLSRHGIIAGPSSGEALHGLVTYLRRMKDQGRLSELAHPLTGEISCVFICADLPYQYMDTYYSKLDQEEFPSIRNAVSRCLGVAFTVANNGRISCIAIKTPMMSDGFSSQRRRSL